MSKNSLFDKLKKQIDEENDTPHHYHYEDWLVFETGETKTVDFQMLDGNRQHFNYQYYIKTWTENEDGTPCIKVFFSMDIVTIKGYRLNKLYEAFREMSVIAVRANDERFLMALSDDDDNDPFVTEIKIDPHKAKKET